MPPTDKQTLDSTADEYLGFGHGPSHEDDEDEATDEQTQASDDADSYVDSWYQVLKARAAETDDES